MGNLLVPRRGLARREDRLPASVPARGAWWSYVWAAPNSLLGLLGAATVRGQPAWWRGTLLVEEAHGGLAALLAWRGFVAITLGHVVIVNRRADDRLLAHELAHVRQQERWGLAFVPVYLLASVTGYRRNPFEQAAVRWARSVSDR